MNDQVLHQCCIDGCEENRKFSSSNFFYPLSLLELKRKRNREIIYSLLTQPSPSGEGYIRQYKYDEVLLWSPKEIKT